LTGVSLHSFETDVEVLIYCIQNTWGSEYCVSYNKWDRAWHI